MNNFKHIHLTHRRILTGTSALGQSEPRSNNNNNNNGVSSRSRTEASPSDTVKCYTQVTSSWGGLSFLQGTQHILSPINKVFLQ